jgi:hypothetical protein
METWSTAVTVNGLLAYYFYEFLYQRSSLIREYFNERSLIQAKRKKKKNTKKQISCYMEQSIIYNVTHGTSKI